MIRRTSPNTISSPASHISHTMWHIIPHMLAVAALSAPPERGRKYPFAPDRRR